MIYVGLGDQTNSNTSFQRLLEYLAPVDPSDFIIRATAYGFLNKHTEALADLEQVIAQFPSHPNGYIQRALVVDRMTKGKVNTLPDYDKAISLAPEAGFSYLLRAMKRMGMSFNDWEAPDSTIEKAVAAKVLEDANRAISLIPNHPMTYQVRGLYYLKHEKNNNLAFLDFSKEIELSKTNPLGYYLRSMTYEATEAGRENAIKDINQAIYLAPKRGDFYVRRADLHLTAKNLDASIDDLTRALEINPEAASLYHYRSIAYLTKKNYLKALDDIESFLKRTPQEERKTEGFFIRGRIKHGMKDYNAALTDFDIVATLDPKHWSNYYYRGRVQEETGKLKQAAADYNRALSLAPPDSKPSVQKEIERLQSTSTVR